MTPKKASSPKRPTTAKKKPPPPPPPKYVEDSDSSSGDESYDYSNASDTDLTGIESGLNEMDLLGRRHHQRSPAGIHFGHKHSPDKPARLPSRVIDKNALEVLQIVKEAEVGTKQRVLELCISGIHPGVKMADIELVIPDKGAVNSIYIEYPPKPKHQPSGQLFNACDLHRGMEKIAGSRSPSEYGIFSDATKKLEAAIDRKHRTDGSTRYRQTILLDEEVQRYTVTGFTPAKHNGKGFYFFPSNKAGISVLCVFFLCMEKHPDADHAFDHNQACDLDDDDDTISSRKRTRSRRGGPTASTGADAALDGMEFEIDSAYDTAHSKGHSKSQKSENQTSPRSYRHAGV